MNNTGLYISSQSNQHEGGKSAKKSIFNDNDIVRPEQIQLTNLADKNGSRNNIM